MAITTQRRLGGRLVLPVVAAAVTFAACEAGDAHVSGPRGADAVARYIAIGTSITMGVQSGGVLYNTQVEAWPALLARAAGDAFAAPLLRAPGCSPPLIAPLSLGRFLSGAAIDAPDTSCAGVFDTVTPPRSNLAVPGATAWAALNLTPKLVAASPATHDAGDRALYPIVLGPTQSQVTAMLVEGASLVSVELGFADVVGAATSGLLTAAGSYTQTAPFTYAPYALFAPAYSAIAESLKVAKAKVVLLSVPHVTRLYAIRPGAELWSARDDLSTFGITVAADCDGSPNLVFTGALIPRLAQLALTAGAAQSLSCADVPGAADAILTPADVAILDGIVGQMNAQIRQIATTNGWAFADLDTLYSGLSAARQPYRATEQLSCVHPYGTFISFDGVHPTLAGNQAIAGLVAAALNSTYGFAIPVAPVPAIAPVLLCPQGGEQ
jgi:hypothetical protein